MRGRVGARVRATRLRVRVTVRARAGGEGEGGGRGSERARLPGRCMCAAGAVVSAASKLHW